MQKLIHSDKLQIIQLFSAIYSNMNKIFYKWSKVSNKCFKSKETYKKNIELLYN